MNGDYQQGADQNSDAAADIFRAAGSEVKKHDYFYGCTMKEMEEIISN